jgi:hypothetical protein
MQQRAFREQISVAFDQTKQEPNSRYKRRSLSRA